MRLNAPPRCRQLISLHELSDSFLDNLFSFGAGAFVGDVNATAVTQMNLNGAMPVLATVKVNANASDVFGVDVLVIGEINKFHDSASSSCLYGEFIGRNFHAQTGNHFIRFVVADCLAGVAEFFLKVRPVNAFLNLQVFGRISLDELQQLRVVASYFVLAEKESRGLTPELQNPVIKPDTLFIFGLSRE